MQHGVGLAHCSRVSPLSETKFRQHRDVKCCKGGHHATWKSTQVLCCTCRDDLHWKSCQVWKTAKGV